jgi:hypothetical protein
MQRGRHARWTVGTQMLEVRRVGYAIAERPVELRADTAITADVRLQRVVSLDSMRVVAIVIWTKRGR